MRRSQQAFKSWFDSLIQSEKEQVIKKKICFFLAKREYSFKELEKKLSKKYGSEYLDLILDQLRFFEEKGWQSDYRFTETFVKSKLNKGFGLNRIRFELKNKGVDIDKTKEFVEDVNFKEIAKNEVIKKYAKLISDWEEVEFKEQIKIKQKIYRFLQYRGLPLIDIESLIEK